MSQEAQASLPVPWPERMVMRFVLGKLTKASICCSDGVASMHSLTNMSGWSRHSLSLERICLLKLHSPLEILQSIRRDSRH